MGIFRLLAVFLNAILSRNCEYQIRMDIGRNSLQLTQKEFEDQLLDINRSILDKLEKKFILKYLTNFTGKSLNAMPRLYPFFV